MKGSFSRGRPAALLSLLLTAAVAMAAVVAVGWPRAAAANHVPGTIYTGTLSNGGSISITVSADGAAVTSLPISYRVGTCSVSHPGNTGGSGLSITNHQFRGVLETSAGVEYRRLAGSFQGGGLASGTLTEDPSTSTCLTAGVNLTWTTSAQTATPTPSPTPTPAPLTVTPNDPYAAGMNSIVILK